MIAIFMEAYYVENIEPKALSYEKLNQFHISQSVSIPLSAGASSFQSSHEKSNPIF